MVVGAVAMCDRLCSGWICIFSTESFAIGVGPAPTAAGGAVTAGGVRRRSCAELPPHRLSAACLHGIFHLVSYSVVAIGETCKLLRSFILTTP